MSVSGSIATRGEPEGLSESDRERGARAGGWEGAQQDGKLTHGRGLIKCEPDPAARAFTGTQLN